jgi:hypothetical protein
MSATAIYYGLLALWIASVIAAYVIGRRDADDAARFEAALDRMDKMFARRRQ